MKKALTMLLVLSMILCLFAGCGSTAATTSTPSTTETTAPSVTSIPETEPAPEKVNYFADDQLNSVTAMLYALGDHIVDFSVELCDGTTVTLSDLFIDHDLVMLNVWATWCGPCRQEFPVMDSAYAGYMDKVAILALSPYDTNEEVAAFKEENGIQNIMMGSDTIGADSLVQEGYPTTILIDRFGNYVYYECGSLLSEEEFTGIWDMFLGDDYTESIVIDGMPAAEYDGEMPDEETLSYLFCSDGTIQFRNEDGCWPFEPIDFFLFASNYAVDNSTASILSTIDADAGEVFAFDYEVDSDPMYDCLNIYVNDELVMSYCGSISGTFGYRFEESGTYEVAIRFEKDKYETMFGGSNTVFIYNARILSGSQADSLMENIADKPCAFDGSEFAIQVLNDNAKKIDIDFPEGVLEATFYNPEFYILSDETVTTELQLGTNYDPYYALYYSDFEPLRVLPSGKISDTGYQFTTEISSIEAGTYSSTYVYFYSDYNNMAADTIKMAVIFKNEENVNYFCQNEVFDLDGVQVVPTWQYADGTQPSTDAIAEIATDYKYQITVINENREPMNDVIINICDDETCQPVVIEDGFFGFDSDVDYPYVIHVLSVPDGYVLDSEVEYVLPAEGGAIKIVILFPVDK